jgi:hypothetical protein
LKGSGDMRKAQPSEPLCRLRSLGSAPRARRSGRGAALVEMVVVVPVFIVLIAGMLFLHHTVAATQRSMLAARRAAWKSAMEGCPGEGGEMPQPDRTSEMGGAPGAEVSTLATIGSATSESEGSVHVGLMAEGAASAAEGRGLEFEADVHSKVIVMCNTKPQPGDLPGVLKWFWNSPGRQALWNAVMHGGH